ncbi:hypothetical protein WICMUC_004900 [Wickerhamomyces mucosus]|uniref:protein kinase C n=1 Tax=Wickerhamomyces mucosus TaxID=1378264 RepID=A0A9P8PEE6_9ASCO|nr:hypothetical protein WICMUC_004900 [Wickerhamomyces mucosus]
MSNPMIEEIQKKILRERNIITGATNMKKKTQNASVIQKCNTNIQEAQQNIDYLSERLNELKFQDANGSLQLDNLTEGEGTGIVTQSDKLKPSETTNEISYTKLDLMKYDCPSLGQRIQHMITQLDSKLKVEQKYYEANEKLSKIYQLDGDRRISSVAEDGRIQSNHKIQLLKKALKRYEAINVNLDQVNSVEDDFLNNVKFRRKPLAGVLTIDISSIRDVDHIASPMFSRKTESFISIKIDDEEKAKTKSSRNDRWNETFNITIEKGNEVEITVYDKIGKSVVPVAIAWFLIADIAEEIRKKKVGQTGVGWVSASRVQNNVISAAPNLNKSDNFTISEKKDEDLLSGETSREPIKSSSWFILEPSGQILLTLGFTKSSTPNKKTLLGGLHRHGAIRKRDEEIFEQHGHQFIQKQFYSIMRCALCGDFLPYNGYQCQDCKFLCHKRCYEKVITKCISKSSNDIDPDELKLNHRIPHRFERVSNRGTNWCCHCGSILPWGRKNVFKCSECSIMCHLDCSHLVPDFCGMPMETANEILTTIKSTEVTRQKFKTTSTASSGYSGTTAANSLDVGRIPTGTEPPDFNVSLDSRPSVPTKSYNQKQLPVQRLPTRQRRPPPELNQEQQKPQQSSEGIYATELNPYDERADHPVPSHHLRSRQQHEEFNKQDLKQHYQKNLQEIHLEEQRRQFEHERMLKEQEKQRHQRFVAEEPAAQEDLSFQPEAEEYQSLNSSNPFSSYNELSSKLDPRYTDHVTTARPIETEIRAEIPINNLQHESKPKQTQLHERRHRPKVGLDDFNFLKVLGRGNFGKVMLGRSHRTKKLCAVKILKKDMIVDNGEIASLQAEKDVFLIANRENHPFLTNLYCCFQTANRIYFVMEFVSGGDLMWHVQQGNFSLRRAKFYASEVLLALEYLHNSGIVYRDLKLDNILLSPEGHIKIADYGLCKPGMWYGETTNTFCGTPEFMAPEILKEQNYSRAVDWWAFGVLLYQMLLGKSPFRGEDEDEVFNAILTDEPLFPIQMASEAVGLLESLLDKNPLTRLGSGPRDAAEIKEHPYFRNIDFDDIRNLRVPPPYIPESKSEEDVSYFEKDFTSEVPRLTPVNSVLDSSTQAQFRGFSYVSDASGL